MEFFITYKPIMIIIHALVAAIGLGAVVVTDTLFFEFLKDFKITDKEDRILQVLSKVVWAALIVLILSGIALYLSAPATYLVKSKFITKMVIFAIIFINGLVLHFYLSPHLKKIAFGPTHLFVAVRLRIMRRIAFASGVVSIISWLTVFILGSVRSIPLTTGQALLGYGAVIILGIIGSQIYATWVKYQSVFPITKD